MVDEARREHDGLDEEEEGAYGGRVSRAWVRSPGRRSLQRVRRLVRECCQARCLRGCRS